MLDNQLINICKNISKSCILHSINNWIVYIYHTSFTIWWTMNSHKKQNNNFSVINKIHTYFLYIVLCKHIWNCKHTGSSNVKDQRTKKLIRVGSLWSTVAVCERSHPFGHVDFLQAFQPPPTSLMNLRYQPCQQNYWYKLLSLVYKLV